MRKQGILLVVMVFMASLLAGCVEEYKTTTVTGKVVEKDYDPPETKTKRVQKNGKVTTKRTHEPAEYEVTIEYNHMKKEFEDRSLYNEVEEGQDIQIHYVQGLDKKGKVLTEDIELIDK